MDLSLFSFSLKVRLWVYVFRRIFGWRVRSFLCFGRLVISHWNTQQRTVIVSGTKRKPVKMTDKPRLRLSFFHQNASHSRHGVHVLVHLKKWESATRFYQAFGVNKTYQILIEHMGTFMPVPMCSCLHACSNVCWQWREPCALALLDSYFVGIALRSRFCLSYRSSWECKNYSCPTLELW